MRILPLGRDRLYDARTAFPTVPRRRQNSEGLGSDRVTGLWRKALLVGFLIRLLVPGLRKKALLLVSGTLLLWVAFSRVRRRRRRDEIEADEEWLKEAPGRPPPAQGVA
jgi:hypothetical protein